MAGGCMVLQAVGAALLSDPPPLPMDSHERRKLIEDIRCNAFTCDSCISPILIRPNSSGLMQLPIFLVIVVIELADGGTLCAVLAGCHVVCAALALAFHPTEALPNPYKLVMT
ncbi:hypothetical protein Emed_001519 [Eimeria media]